MSALPLFDSVLLTAAGGAPANPSAIDRLAQFAGQLVRSALTDLADIESFDVGLAKPVADDFDPQSAILLRGMYEQWTRDADAVLERVAKVERMGIAVTAAQDLRDAQGRLLACSRSHLTTCSAAAANSARGARGPGRRSVASWALAFNEQARAALLRLDPWLQEEILDELDRLALNPGQLRRGGASPACVADLTRESMRVLC